VEFEEENNDGGGNGNRKEQANGRDKNHERVNLRREVGGLLRIDWQLRLHGLVSSSWQASRMRLAQIPGGRQSFAAARNQNSSDNAENGEDPAETDELENRGAVSGGGGIVVIAKEQNVIDGRADLSCRSVHETEAHVAAGIFDAIEVARDVAVRGKKQDAAGVGEEIVFGIEGETEISGFGGGFDGFLRAGEKMPAGIRLRAAESERAAFLFLFGSHLRRFAGIKADENNFVVAPGIEGKHAQDTDDALLDLIAKHGAAVVDESEDHRLLVP